MRKSLFLVTLLCGLLLSSCSQHGQSSELSLISTLSSSSSSGFISEYVNGNGNDIINEAFINDIKKSPYHEAKSMLLDMLKDDNLQDINELAIEIGVYKPMYRYCGLKSSNDEYITYGYVLSPTIGNDAYLEAIDNMHFRKALLAIFTHSDDMIITSPSNELFDFYNDESPYNYEYTYKTASDLEDVSVNEGIIEAKNEYQLAINTGLSDRVIELYMRKPYDAKPYHNRERNRINLLNDYIKEVFGDQVIIVEKDFSDNYLSSGLITPLQFIAGPSNFYHEVVLSMSPGCHISTTEDKESIYTEGSISTTYDYIVHALNGFNLYTIQENTLHVDDIDYSVYRTL